MRSLQQFVENKDAFMTPLRLPQFFHENLVDPNRVVKGFVDDPQAHLRVFYYQYLKICFEINSPKSEELVQKIEELINNPNFKFYFFEEDDTSLFNDTQAKAFITEFFGELSSVECTVMEALNKYPIMDIIMVHFFRTLLILMDKSQSLDNFIPRDELLAFLCPFFGIDVEIHDACIKYVDSDVFVYDDNEKAVYMAYMSDTDSEVQNNSQDKQINSQELLDKYADSKPLPSNFAPQSTVSNVVEEKKRSLLVDDSKGSFIASEWADYTIDPLAARLTDKGTVLKGSDHFIEPKAKAEQPKSNLLGGSKPFNYIETASMSSGADTKYMQDVSSNHGPTGYGQADYLAKSNPVSVPFKNEPYQAAQPSANFQQPINTAFSSFQPPLEQPAPTKDFSQNNQPFSSSSYQSSQAPQPYSQGYKPTAYYESSKLSQSPPAPKPASFEPNAAKDLIYQPKVDNAFSSYQTSQSIQSNTASSKVDSFIPKTAVEATSKAQFGVSQQVTQSQTVSMGKKKPFGLNVSDEFTSSLTIKKMAEPFKSNVTTIKQRARQFRSSLAPFVK